MKKSIVAAAGLAIALSPVANAFAQTRLELFDYGYIIVPDRSLNRYRSGLGAANTNRASERSLTNNAPQIYALTCSRFDTQQEAQFHYLLGSAPADLDADVDGLACEHLSTAPRTDGVATSIISTTTGQVEIRQADDSYYIWVERATVAGTELADITTGNFPSSRSARQHYERYYRGR